MAPFRPLGAIRRALSGSPAGAPSHGLAPAGNLLGRVTAFGAAASLAVAAAGLPGAFPGMESRGGSARAQGTSGLVEFRWDNNKDYNKLYYFVTNTLRQQRSDYYLVLRPKDRKTAILKLTITIPDHFDTKIDPKFIQLCNMSSGGMTKRTRCEKKLDATIEVSPGGKAIEVFPATPIPVGGTVGVFMTLFNPFNAGMFQFNALAQAPGEVPISGYLGSWLIEIDPN
jgi:hypothetical protein